MEGLPATPEWVLLDVLARVSLALLIGLLVGLEREWRGKEAGLRTFGLVSMLGALSGLLGSSHAVAGSALVALLVVFLNLQAMRAEQSTELTTSAALFVIFSTGVLCGLGHRVMPVAVAFVTAGLLSWKESLAEFGHKLTAQELRSAIVLGILAFAVYPVLPENAIDPWSLIQPRAAWLTVLLIAGIGFANYVLWKLFGSRGIEIAGFLGGLVNSTVTVTELASRLAGMGPSLAKIAYRGIMFSVAAMALRNAVVLGLLHRGSLGVSAAPLALMCVTSAALGWFTSRPALQVGETQSFELKSPFSLLTALKFGAILVVLQAAETLAHGFLGQYGFYAVSLAGGVVSSASAVAAAAMLAAAGSITPTTAGVGALLASLASATVNIVLVARVSGSRELTRRIALSTALVIALGLGAAVVMSRVI